MPFPRDRDFDAQVIAAVRQVQVPADLAPDFPALVKAIIAAESGFNPGAYRAEPQIGDASRGLMQVLERTARALGYTASVGNDVTRTGGLYEPQTSVLLGTRLLAQNIAQARNVVEVAISAYNAGWSPSRPWDAKRTATGAFVNAAYVSRVLGFWNEYRGQPLALGGPAPAVTTPKPAGVKPASAGLEGTALIAALIVALVLLYLTLWR